VEELRRQPQPQAFEMVGKEQKLGEVRGQHERVAAFEAAGGGDRAELAGASVGRGERVPATGDAHVELPGAKLFGLFLRQPQSGGRTRLAQRLLGFLAQHDGTGHCSVEPARLRCGDYAAGDHLQGRAVRVVAVEGLDRVVVGDITDAALEGDGLLDLAGLA
jgi:hypothetical protein